MVLEAKIWVLGMLFAPGVQSQWTELRIMHMDTSLHIHTAKLLLYISIDIYMKLNRSSRSCLQLRSTHAVRFIPLSLLVDNLSLPQPEPDSRHWPPLTSLLSSGSHAHLCDGTSPGGLQCLWTVLVVFGLTVSTCF